MNLQEPTSIKPQPIRLSMNTPLDKVYSLAKQLHTDPETQDAFFSKPGELLSQFGMGLNHPEQWAMGHKHHDKPGTGGKPGKEDGSEGEAIAVCAVVTNVGVAGVVICGVALAVPPPGGSPGPGPFEEIS